MRTPTRLTALFSAALLACAALAACSQPTLEYIPNGGVYTMAQAEDVASSIDLSDVEGTKTSEGPALRKERLLQLREADSGASLLADALTRDFPSGTSSVPLLIESATVDGIKAWLIIEAWGDKDGTLSHRRLWVLDRSSFTVLASSSFN